jgi:hypothetical protein
MTEQELLVDCLRRLNQVGAAYMLTGSMASNYWGIPRTTHDLDFVLQLPRSTIPTLLSAFADAFLLQASAIESAYQPPHQFNAIDQRSALKVDFWMLRDDPFEQTMFSRRMEIQLFGVAAWIATAEDVILHKLYWHQLTPSERQLDDAAGIVAVQSDKLNHEYLRHWASQLNFRQGLDDLLAGRIGPKST